MILSCQMWSIKKKSVEFKRKSKKLNVSDFFIKLKLNSKILYFWIIINLLLKQKFWEKN